MVSITKHCAEQETGPICQVWRCNWEPAPNDLLRLPPSPPRALNWSSFSPPSRWDEAFGRRRPSWLELGQITWMPLSTAEEEEGLSTTWPLRRTSSWLIERGDEKGWEDGNGLREIIRSADDAWRDASDSASWFWRWNTQVRTKGVLQNMQLG